MLPTRTVDASLYARCPGAQRRRCAAAHRFALLCFELSSAFTLAVAAAAHAQPASSPRGPVARNDPLTIQSQPGEGIRVIVPTIRSGNNTSQGYSPRSGLQLEVDASWPGEYGYKPVTFTFSTPKPNQAAQQITVELHAGDWNTRGRSITVEEDGELPVGAVSTTVTVLAPQYVSWQWIGWEVWIDGVKEDLLSVDEVYGGSTGSGRAALIVDYSQVSANQLVSDLTLTTGGGHSPFRFLSINELPADWMHYTSVDVVIMPAASLVAMSELQPKRAKALLRWVRCGGNLWLSDVGDAWDMLPDVEQAIGATNQVESTQATIDPIARGWVYPRLANVEKESAEGTIALWGLETAYTTSEPADDDDDASSNRPIDRYRRESRADRRATIFNAPDSSQWFTARSHGLGLVAAYRGRIASHRSSIDGGRQSVDAMEMTLLQPRLSWASRHGNVPDYANYQFNNLLIPGVGLAPVGVFQVLITLFVITIGPVNYFLLKRAKRLPMLLVTVPSAAAAVTMLLFAYGLLTDGFTVRVRARSFTALDQRSGQKVAASRLSYYAGMAPSEGLKFPTDAAIYPINAPSAFSQMDRRGDGTEREIQWGADQWLRTGWITSRTPTQLLTIQPSRTQKKLQLSASDEGLKVANELGMAVGYLAVQDDQGRFYWCTKLASGERRQLEPQTADEVLPALRELLQENEPEFPPGGELSGIRRGAYGVELSDGLMEAPIRALASPLIRELGSRVYVAVTHEALQLDLGLPDLVEEDGFHVIRGTW